MDSPIVRNLEFYHRLAGKYDIEIKSHTTRTPGEIIYQDEWQVATTGSPLPDWHTG